MLTEQEFEELRPLIYATNMTISASLDLKKKLLVHIREQQEEIDRLVELIRKYPDFSMDFDETGCPDGNYTCSICDGGGSTIKSPQHKPDCPRLAFAQKYGE